MSAPPSVKAASVKVRRWDSDPRYFGTLMILFTAGVTVILFGGELTAAALSYGFGALYAALLFRVVSRSGRAALAMHIAFSLMFIAMAGIQNHIGVPVSGPMLMGFSAGSFGAACRWTGEGRGTRWGAKRERDADGTYTGGRQLALINAACAAVALLFPLTFLLDGTGLATIVVSTLAGFAAGWALFRFARTMQGRSIPLFAVFLALVPATIIAGLYGYGPAPIIGGFGLISGALVGGRYWSGERFGAPRPPFAGRGNRRRRKKKARKPPARA